VTAGQAASPQAVRRLNWGCGDWVPAGWINSDIKERPGVVVADIREGLPFETDSIEYAVSIHALPELSYRELVPALEELRRVLKPGGVLRLGLPDLERGLDAYRRGDRRYFQIPDEEMQSLGGKLVAQLVWYGFSRTVFVAPFVEELLFKARFARVDQVAYRETANRFPAIVELDNRAAESLFVEAVK
jgi:SAM-dependent methyltransferase